MILFDLSNQTLTGEGSDKVSEVIWSDGQCRVNKVLAAPAKSVTITGNSAIEVGKKIEQIISGCKDGMFAVLQRTAPFKMGSEYQTKFVYSELNL